MNDEEMKVQEAVINLYRSATGDNVSTKEDVVKQFAKDPIGQLEYCSQMGGRVHYEGHIPIGMLEEKSVEEILMENGLIA